MRNLVHAFSVSVLVLAVAVAACRPQQPPEPAYSPTATVKDLM